MTEPHQDAVIAGALGRLQAPPAAEDFWATLEGRLASADRPTTGPDPLPVGPYAPASPVGRNGAYAVATGPSRDRQAPARHTRGQRILLVAAVAVVVAVIVTLARPTAEPVTVQPGATIVVGTTAAPGTTLVASPARAIDPTAGVDPASVRTSEPVALPPGTRLNRNAPTIWTGSEVIVAGGVVRPNAGGWTQLAESPVFDPRTNQVRLLPAPPVALIDLGALAVWTGREVILVAPGVPDQPTAGAGPFRAVAYDSARGWRPIADPPAHVLGMVWAGDRLIGWTPTELVVYFPTEDSWKTFAAGSFGTFGSTGIGVWSGTDLWFIADSTVRFRRGAAPGVTIEAPAPFRPETATWTGSTVLITANDWERGVVRVAQFDPATATWREGTPGPRYTNRAVTAWTGDLLVALEWGSGGMAGDPNGPPEPPRGRAYRPATDTWTEIPAIPRAANPIAVTDRLVMWSEATVDNEAWTISALAWTPPR